MAEISTWRGLEVVKSGLEEKIEAARVATKVGLDFDVAIISFDKGFNKTDVKRLEPEEAAGVRS